MASGTRDDPWQLVIASSYVPPVVEALGRAAVEHDARHNRMGASWRASPSGLT